MLPAIRHASPSVASTQYAPGGWLPAHPAASASHSATTRAASARACASLPSSSAMVAELMPV